MLGYRLATVAMFLFSSVFAFELHIRKHGRLRAGAKTVVGFTMGASAFQMLSCFLWYLSATFSPDDDDAYLSMTIEDDKHVVCIGDMGAECLISLFQSVSVAVSFYQVF